jgi:hypothetical protein
VAVVSGCDRKVDVRLPRKGDSNSCGARPVHLVITMIKWIRTSRLSIEMTLSSVCGVQGVEQPMSGEFVTQARGNNAKHRTKREHLPGEARTPENI